MPQSGRTPKIPWLEGAPDNDLQLPPRIYDVVMRRLAGQTLREIGAAYDVPHSSIRNPLHRAMCILRHPSHHIMPKRHAHIPLWDKVFGTTAWQADPRYAQWLD